MTTALVLLREFLTWLLMPFRLSLVLIAIGVFRRRRSLAVAGLILLYVASLPAVSESLGRWLENQYPHLEAAQCPTADAIVALSGFAEPDRGHPGMIRWTDRTDRFEQAVQLFRLQKAPILLFTDSQSPLGELVRQAAVERGVPDSAVRLTGPVATTADEAREVQDYLKYHDIRRIILVTSAIHMSRAALLFRRAGIDFVPFPVDYHSDTWQWNLGDFLPLPGALDQNEKSLHEIYGNLLYRLK